MSDAQNNIEARLKELKNVHRLISNTSNLICDVEIKGGHALAVGEILQWLDGFRKSIETQMTTLEATLPKKEEAKIIDLQDFKESTQNSKELSRVAEVTAYKAGE